MWAEYYCSTLAIHPSIAMSPATRYRFAALVLASVGLLIAVFASPAAAQSNRTAELQQLVDDFGYQLKLIRLLDPSAAEKRLRQLAIARDRWNTSTRTETDAETMRQWLIDSIQASMPGSLEPMPELPWFEQRLAKSKSTAAPESPPPPVSDTRQAVITRRPTEPQPVVAPKPAPASDPQPSAAVAEAWKQHPGAKPIDLGDPFADDQPLANSTTATRRIAMRPTPARPASTKVEINVAELGARVRGYVHGLRGVEARLLRSPTMTTDDLLLATRELKQLAEQREFVSLYLNALSDAERARAGNLPSLDDAKALIAKQVDTLQAGGQLPGDMANSLHSTLDSI